MAVKERDVVNQSKDAQGNSTIDFPLARLGWIEDTADVKTTPAETDYIPIVDASDNGQMKKTTFKALAEAAAEIGGGGGAGGNALRITFASGFRGRAFTVSGGGDVINGTVPDALVVEVSLKNCNTTYTISATASTGDAYSTTVATGPYYGQYTATLNTFTASLEVTARAGAVVTATKGGNSQTATANSSGKATFTLTSSGSYTISATYDGVNSNSTTVNATTNGGSYTASVAFITLTLTVESGSNVTIAKGSWTKTYTSVGAATIYLPETGTYSITATKNGQTATDSLDATAYTAYTKTLNYFVYCGVQVAANSDPATAVTYVGDAVGMSTGYNAWKDNGIFKNIKSCVVKNGEVQYYLDPTNFAKKADGSAATINSESAGDVMIQIPKLGYKMTESGGVHTIYVTDDPAASGYCYRAHSLDNEGDCDFIYVGAYFACNKSSKLYSLSGQAPAANITLTNARSYAQARGTGFQLLSFYPLTLLQCLYLLMYKNRNGQSALGRGYVDGNSAATNTGGANSRGMCYGETTGKQQMKFLGIEDFWGNLYCWIDGIYSDGSRNIKTAFKNFADDGSSYPYTKASGVSSNIGNYMSDIQGTNEGGFVAKAVSGSATTYWADHAYLFASKCAYFGGNWANGDSAGPFQFNVSNTASNSYANLGARLIYKHKKAA